MNEFYRYEIQINGMSGIFSGFLVAFKHLIPEHRIAIMGGKVSIRVKVKYHFKKLSCVVNLIKGIEFTWCCYCAQYYWACIIPSYCILQFSEYWLDYCLGLYSIL